MLLVHLCFSICALLSRELLEDCGQPAEHEDGTESERQIVFRLFWGGVLKFEFSTKRKSCLLNRNVPLSTFSLLFLALTLLEIAEMHSLSF